ncbi:HORMA domain-containing protein 1 [Caerostris extrusa]|uniref:HORMA domain-containing protein 1 n=1 Tax=Caerostris extrusa TaxID=172846 RepID=A0AAV4N9B3_CAEEX|nr:HORMA domain-containing protein 1 [Caerostris extrusa]
MSDYHEFNKKLVESSQSLITDKDSEENQSMQNEGEKIFLDKDLLTTPFKYEDTLTLYSAVENDLTPARKRCRILFNSDNNSDEKLQELSIGICINKENYNEVIEAYKLLFCYKDDECSVTCQNKTKTFSPKLTDPTVTASLLMLKNITSLNSVLGNLPKNVHLCLKLLYYDDVTPEDYEPPGI